MANMCKYYLALRATKSNETTHVLCANFNMAVSEESQYDVVYIGRVDQSQRCSQF